ncbi:MAG TPA: enolase C-terminal domain-like protein [Burkholderiales bacterium]|nr:enolase C-terminal domain-like protein [Burkholderiales bacterium]
MKFTIRALDFFERDVRLRMPFRFGVVTLSEATQAFARARIRLEDGREAAGAAAELLVPKWFDKDPRLTNDENVAQLRSSLRIAKDAYLAGGANTAFGHWLDNYGPQIALCAAQELNPLVAGFGPALLDRALLDALCRALGVSFYEAMAKNLPGMMAPPWQEDLAAFDVAAFLATLAPRSRIAARHTVGLLDPLSGKKLDDGLPATLEEVIERYGQRWFKLKLSGDAQADAERLSAIASVLERIAEGYRVTLDGNEQFADAEEVLALWRRLRSLPALKRLLSSVAFIEQPIARQSALGADVAELAEEKPLLIDESDDSLESFPRARRLGYTGVSSKGCKGLYKSLLNRARCALWNREEGAERYFMSGEDLTVQAGVAVQQDLALVSLLGLEHVERNGHHYVNGMAGAPAAEQQAFLRAHPDLYESSAGAVRLKIRQGLLDIGSLGCAGFASGASPDWKAMRSME